MKEEKPDTVKVFNLLKELHRLVEEQGRTAPYLLLIVEPAEEIRRHFQEGEIEAHQALQELDGLVRQLNEDEEERRNKGDGTNRPSAQQAFVGEWWLRSYGIAPHQATDVATVMESAFAHSPDWMTSRHQERDFCVRLYKALLDIAVSELIVWADAILNLLRTAAE